MPASYKGRIAFFYHWGNLGAFSSLRDTLILLVEHGYLVDFFTQYDVSFPSFEMDIKGLSIINRPEAFFFVESSLPPLIHRFRKGGRPYRWLMMKLLYPLLREFTCNFFLRKQHASIPYHCMVGIDPEGLASASFYAKLLDVPSIYWSLELLLAKEIITQEKKNIKKLEIINNKQVAFTIIQDRWRGQALIKENGIDPTSLFYVPNAPRGRSRREKSDYLYKRLNIPREFKIILCAGTIGSWAMSTEIVAAAADWPNGYVLVMQSRAYNSIRKDKYIEKIREIADPRKVIISYEPVPQSEYRNFVDSADVGLAFYMPNPPNNYFNLLGENIRLIGLSSGKIAGYLYSGLPVIVNDVVIGPKELVQSSGSGFCVTHPAGIKDALSVVFDRYDWYVENACRCFDESLELEKHLTPILKKLELFTNSEYHYQEYISGGNY